MAKSIFTLLLLCVCVCVCNAQQNCELDSKSAPLLLNLKIGMSAEETQAIVGKSLKIKVKKNDEHTIFQNYIKNPAPNSLNGVRALYLRFFDKKLYQIEIFYEPRQDLKTVEEISNVLSFQFNFSTSHLQIKDKTAEIRCNDLSLIADNVLNPRIQLTDEMVFAEIEAKRNKAK